LPPVARHKDKEIAIMQWRGTRPNKEPGLSLMLSSIRQKNCATIQHAACTGKPPFLRNYGYV